MKVYGKVTKLKSNDKGVWYAKIEGINNDDGRKLIIRSDDTSNSFNGKEFKVGLKVCVKADKDGEKPSYLKVYDNPENQPKKVGVATGVLVGHSLKVATALSSRGSKLDFVELGMLGYTATREVQTMLKEKYPDMSDKDLGLSAGNAILCGCELVFPTYSTLAELKEKLVETSYELYTIFVPKVTEYIEDQQKT